MAATQKAHWYAQSMADGSTTGGPRICVVGASGSGKTTLATRLSARLNVPYISNDELLWLPDWVLRDKVERDRLMRDAVAAPAWTFDRSLGADACDQHIASRATMIVWLDYPLHVVMRRVIVRTVRRVALRERLFSGNVERFRRSFLDRDSIILWAATSHGQLKLRHAALFERLSGSGAMLVRHTSPLHAEQWLRGLPRTRSQ